MKKQDRIEYEYQRAIKENPNNAVLYNDYGIFLSKYKKEYKQALKYFNRAIKFEPNNKVYKLNFNRAIQKQEQQLSLRHNLFMIFLTGVMCWIGINEYTNVMNLVSLFILAQLVLIYQKNNTKKLLSYQFLIN